MRRASRELPPRDHEDSNFRCSHEYILGDSSARCRLRYTSARRETGASLSKAPPERNSRRPKRGVYVPIPEAVPSNVEQRQIAASTFDLKLRRDGPHLLRADRRLRAGDHSVAATRLRAVSLVLGTLVIMTSSVDESRYLHPLNFLNPIGFWTTGDVLRVQVDRSEGRKSVCWDSI